MSGRDNFSDAAKEWLDRYTSQESHAITQRCVDGTASPVDQIDFAMGECREAMEVLPPSAPANGRGGAHGDGFHAGCCAFRAWGELSRLKQRLQERAREEVGWLIEHHYTIPNSGMRYWEGIDPDMSSCWTENPNNAVRFARKVDAESLRETLEYMWGDVRVAEHMWVGPVKP